MNPTPTDAERLVILPSYNSGPQLVRTARAVLERWSPVWVALDGSTDESVAEIQALAAEYAGLRVFALVENQSKRGDRKDGVPGCRTNFFMNFEFRLFLCSRDILLYIFFP